MGTLAREIWEGFDEEASYIFLDIDDIYRKVAHNPNYWGGSRVTRLERDIGRHLGRLHDSADRYLKDSIPTLVSEGAKTVNNKLTEEQIARVSQKIINEELKNLDVVNRRALRDARRWGDDIRKIREPLTSTGAVDQRANMLTRVRRTSVKSDVGKLRYDPPTYAKLRTRSASSVAYNLGVLEAARAEDLTYVLISDGTDCGFTSHDDPRLANGLVLRLDQAEQYPLAHPACQRTFSVTSDTRGRKRAGPIRKKIAVAAASAAGITFGVAAVNRALQSERFVSTLNNYARSANPMFAEVQGRLIAEVERLKSVGIDKTVNDIANEIRDSASQFAEGVSFTNTSDASESTARVLGIFRSDRLSRKVVGDAFGDFTEFDMGRRYRLDGISVLDLENSITRNAIDNFTTGGFGGNVTYDTPSIFSPGRRFGGTWNRGGGRITGGFGTDVFGESGTIFDLFKENREEIAAKIAKKDQGKTFRDRLRGSASWRIGDHVTIGGSRRKGQENIIKYTNVRLGQFAKFRVSKVKHGIANRFILNPNGMLRAGFIIDPRTGYIVPNFRFVPKGPIRLKTTVNRAQGRLYTGQIDSSRLFATVRDASIKESVGQTFVDDILERGRATEASLKTNSILEPTTNDADNIKGIFQTLKRERKSQNSQYLRFDDFEPGAVRNMMYLPDNAGFNDIAPGMILRGEIPDALILRVAGQDVPIDLVIKNGKFRTQIYFGTGRITSVSTEVKLIVGKHVRLGANLRMSLAPLDAYSFADLRHLNLGEILEAFDVSSLGFFGAVKKNVQIVSIMSELRAFGYTPFEVSKILRIKWEDAIRLQQAAEAALRDSFGIQKINMATAIDNIYAPVSKLQNLDLSVRFYIDVFRKLGSDAIAKLQKLVKGGSQFADFAFDIIYEEFRKDPLRFVNTTANTLAKINEAYYIKFGHRPKISEASAMNKPEIEQLTRILALQPDEIARAARIGIDEAEDIYHRAASATYTNTVNVQTAKAPARLRRYYGVAHNTDVSDLLDEASFYRWIGDDRSYAVGRSIIEDANAVAAMLEAEFPKAQNVEWLWSRLDMGENVLAYYSWMGNKYGLGAKTANAIFLPKATVDIWTNGELRKVMVQMGRKGWFAQYPPAEVSTLVHEMGHHLHITNYRKTTKLIVRNLNDTGLFRNRYNHNNAWAIPYFDGYNVAEHLSIYGSTQFEELVAEAFAEYMLSPNPRPMAKAVGEALKEFYNS